MTAPAPGPIALVVNPVATRAGRGRRAEVVRALAPLGLEWSLVTRGRGDAARLSRLAADEGARLVVTLGGDGTAAESAGALAGGDVAMVPLPGGNANVFARALGWPPALAAALAALTPAARSVTHRFVTLGTLRAEGVERTFVINAGMGLDAAVVEWIEARPWVKRRLRHAGYALGAVRIAPRARGARILVAPDGGPDVAARTVIVACGSPYTYMGARPLDLAPGAAFDGRLAWAALTRLRPAEVGGLVIAAARGGAPARGGALVGGTVGLTLAMRADRPVPLQADGEVLGRHVEAVAAPGPVLRTLDPRSAAILKSPPVPPT